MRVSRHGLIKCNPSFAKAIWRCLSFDLRHAEWSPSEALCTGTVLTSSKINVVAFHPNLFGKVMGGVLIDVRRRLEYDNNAAIVLR
jgi:hypothetical protein